MKSSLAFPFSCMLVETKRFQLKITSFGRAKPYSILPYPLGPGFALFQITAHNGAFVSVVCLLEINLAALEINPQCLESEISAQLHVCMSVHLPLV